MTGDPFVLQIEHCGPLYDCFDPEDPHKHIQIISVPYGEFTDFVYDVRMYDDETDTIKRGMMADAVYILLKLLLDGNTVDGVGKVDPYTMHRRPRRMQP